MGITNVLLVRHRDGFSRFERNSSIATWGMREGFLSLAQLNRAQAEVVCESAFDAMAEPSVAYTAAVFPRGGDVPFDDYTLGDTVTVPAALGGGTELVRVLGLTISQDQANGSVRLVPELNSVRKEVLERHDDWLRSMVNGTLAGALRQSQPTQFPTTPGTKQSAMPGVTWNGRGLVSDGIGVPADPFIPIRDTRFVVFTGVLRVPDAADDTVVDLVVDGTTAGTLTIPAAAKFASLALVVDMQAGVTELVPDVVSTGSDAEGLVVSGWSEP